jgi:hypothetical protein
MFCKIFPFTLFTLCSSVVDPGCLSRFRIFFYPGSASKKLSILIKKICSSSRKYDPGCSSRIWIPDPEPDFLPIPDPGFRKAPALVSRIRIRITEFLHFSSHLFASNYCRFFVQAEDWTPGGRCQGTRIRGQQEEHSAGDYFEKYGN